MSSEEKGPSVKQKLDTIVSGFDDFDVEMKRGTRVSYKYRFILRKLEKFLRSGSYWCSLDFFNTQQRREKDEFKITELKNEMNRLDNELTVEIKRRTEMNKSTQIVRILIHEYIKSCCECTIVNVVCLRILSLFTF